MKNRNIEITLLKALGIIAVVSCHIGVNFLNLIGIPISATEELFPEYSYHIPLFIFTSGYFYNKVCESNILGLISKRINMLIKYAKCNLFYFILSFILVSSGLLLREIDFSFKSFFIEPFLGGFQFYFNGPSWFVPFLFLLQISFTFIRRIYNKTSTSFDSNKDTCIKEEIRLLVYLIFIGFLSTCLSSIYPVVDESMNLIHSLIRILFGLQFFQLGYVYRAFLEDKIKLSFLSFIILILVKILFIIIFENYSFSLRALKFDSHFIILPFVVSILGIIYCLHLVKFILCLKTNLRVPMTKWLCIIGENTWSIMMHHLLIKWCLLKFYQSTYISDEFSNFGSYVITPILCILLPIMIAYFPSYIRQKRVQLIKNT